MYCKDSIFCSDSTANRLGGRKEVRDAEKHRIVNHCVSYEMQLYRVSELML